MYEQIWVNLLIIKETGLVRLPFLWTDRAISCEAGVVPSCQITFTHRRHRWFALGRDCIAQHRQRHIIVGNVRRVAIVCGQLRRRQLLQQVPERIWIYISRRSFIRGQNIRICSYPRSTEWSRSKQRFWLLGTWMPFAFSPWYDIARLLLA